MPRKEWTEEERKAFGEKMKAAREAKAPQDAPTFEPTQESTEQPTVTLTQDQFQEMLSRIESLENQKQTTQPTQSTAQLNSQGAVVGVIERFPVDPMYYKSPVDGLYDLPDLKRYAMRENYEIRWQVTPTKYQTANGTWFVEPRFELTLLRRMFDEEDPTLELPTKIVLGKASFFNDPPADILEASLAGVALEDLDKGEFQEKMRMYRYSFWLRERLNPRKPESTKAQSEQRVIGGKVYEIETSTKPYEG